MLGALFGRGLRSDANATDAAKMQAPVRAISETVQKSNLSQLHGNDLARVVFLTRTLVVFLYRMKQSVDDVPLTSMKS